MKKIRRMLTVSLLLCVGAAPCAPASPWAEKPGNYFQKTGRKFVFGLENSLFSWLQPWVEADDPAYSKPWTGFMAGWGKAVVYTASGLIQLATFPIPVDFPSIEGIHLPRKEKKQERANVTKLAVEAPSQKMPEAYEEAVPAKETGPGASSTPAASQASPVRTAPAPSGLSAASETAVPSAAPTGENRKDAAMEAALEAASQHPDRDVSQTGKTRQSPVDK